MEGFLANFYTVNYPIDLICHFLSSVKATFFTLPASHLSTIQCNEFVSNKNNNFKKFVDKTLTPHLEKKDNYKGFLKIFVNSFLSMSKSVWFH